MSTATETPQHDATEAPVLTPAPKTTVEQVRDAAEKAVRVTVGAAAVATDRVTDTVDTFTSRHELRREIDTFERRGEDLLERVEGEIRRSRNNVEREIRRSRDNVERGIRERGDDLRSRVEDVTSKIPGQGKAASEKPAAGETTEASETTTV